MSLPQTFNNFGSTQTRRSSHPNLAFILATTKRLPNRFLSARQAAKLTLAATTGIPLIRWGNGLTVLLEKVVGNIYINKMRAICLLEANYNWLNKYVFAKHMMDKAFQEDIVLVE